jgi:hypothetical protein
MAIWRRHESWLSWFPWYRRQARDADLARELHDHLDLEADEQRAAGLSPEEACYAAHRALGNTLMIEEDVRAARGFQWLETCVQRELHRSRRRLSLIECSRQTPHRSRDCDGSSEKEEPKRQSWAVTGLPQTR